MGTPHKILHDMAARLGRVVTKTAAATLTADEMREGAIVMTGADALTLPAAAELPGQLTLIAFQAAGTIVSPAGIGGGAAVTATMAAGEFVLVWSDGTYWHFLHNEPLA
jgi:hypothetical protein